EGLTSFSVAPLRLASLLGLLLAGIALVFGAKILVEVLFFGVAVPGYPSVVVGLMVLGGVQLVMIGIMGEDIGKILSEIKARPVFFGGAPRGEAGGREPGVGGAGRAQRGRIDRRRRRGSGDRAPECRAAGIGRAAASPPHLAMCRRLRHLARREC